MKWSDSHFELENCFNKDSAWQHTFSSYVLLTDILCTHKHFNGCMCLFPVMVSSTRISLATFHLCRYKRLCTCKLFTPIPPNWNSWCGLPSPNVFWMVPYLSTDEPTSHNIFKFKSIWKLDQELFQILSSIRLHTFLLSELQPYLHLKAFEAVWKLNRV